ncbi:MAG: LppX_LprAFG lipoprotein [Chloroflexi bacterium]|nr:MAG: LppX_LprAFG lipoprotein [Chloroflexota bacterium]
MVQRILLLGVLLGVFVVACREAPPPELPPEEILQRSAERMQALSGFHFVIERTGAPAYLDPDGTISFRRAEGDYVAPDRTRAVVRVIAPGLVTDVNVVSVAAVQWQTNILTGAWEELPPNWGFNPAVLFDAEVGLQAVLTADFRNLSLVGTEKLDDGPDELLYVVSGDVAGERMYRMSGGLIGPEMVQARLWIRPSSFELVRALVTEPVAEASEPSVWQIDFSEFGRVVAIEPPVQR